MLQTINFKNVFKTDSGATIYSTWHFAMNTLIVACRVALAIEPLRTYGQCDINYIVCIKIIVRYDYMNSA